MTIRRQQLYKLLPPLLCGQYEIERGKAGETMAAEEPHDYAQLNWGGQTCIT